MRSRYRPAVGGDPTERDLAGTRVEPLWPVVVATGSFIALTLVLRIALPRRESVGPHWLVPVAELVLLVVLVVAAHLEPRARWLRPAALTLILMLLVAALVSTITLIVQLVTNAKVAQSADSLLASGVLVYLGNALVFALSYWQLDSGGPRARARRLRPHPDFAFTQQLSPELAPPDWRPHFVDYLALGFTTNTAFSPTDAMPLTPWAKLTMAAQSLISLTVVGLVIARAVNVL
jgi:hypothetical protein